MPVFYHPDQEPTLAGQPQENSWTQQGNGYSQGAPGYGSAYEQQGSPEPYPQQGQAYEQQPGAYEQQGTYPQEQVYEQQTYQQPQTYEPAYDQTTVYEQQAQQSPGQYDAAGQQAYAQPQNYPGQQPFEQRALPSGQGQGGQGWEQWRLPQQQARPPKAPKTARTGRGFVGSLFDFGFTSFVTPKIIKVLYVLVTAWTILWALAFLRLGFHYGGMAGGLGTLIIVDPILILVSLGVFRVLLEFFMVTFRMQEDLKALRDRTAASAVPGSEGNVGAGSPSPDGA